MTVSRNPSDFEDFWVNRFLAFNRFNRHLLPQASIVLVTLPRLWRDYIILDG